MNVTHRLGLAAALLIALLSAGCTTPPAQPPGAEPSPGEGRRLSDLEELLLKAKTSPPPMAAEYTLLAAEQLLAEERQGEAVSLLDDLSPSTLDLAQSYRLVMLQSKIALEQEAPDRALLYLDRLPDSAALQSEERRHYETRRLQALRMLEEPTAIISQLIQLIPQAQPEESAALTEELWNNLRELSATDLKAMLERPGNNYEAQGWLELAQLTLHRDQDLSKRSQALKEWLTLWDMHTAASNLPASLRPLRVTAGHVEAEKIGLLLPLSGPLEKPAAAIRDGFMAAYYAYRNSTGSQPQIQVFDSNQISDLQSFYDEAAARGINYIIGPLEKEKVQALQSLPLTIPTLALNYTQDAGAQSNLFQFGLSAEDEARQVAHRAWSAGHRIAVSLTPDTPWGHRIEEAFVDQWLKLGGLIAHQSRFTGENDFSERISELLGVDQSQARAKQLQQTLQTKLEFETRRRQDADFLFLSALPEDARQIKPTLAFHYASQLPVYATSHVFSGLIDIERDQDLNGIVFGETPWLLAPTSPIKAALAEKRADASSRFGRLYALGADAFNLYPYLEQLRALPGSYLQGETGRLELDAERRISRQLIWAQFNQGAPEVLAPATNP